MVGEDQAVGEVTRRRTRQERIVNSKEAAQPQPLIVCDDVSALGCGAGGARYQMHTRDSCDAQFIDLIARDRDGGNGQGGAVSNAKPQSATAPRVNKMLAVRCRDPCQRLPARQPHQREVRFSSFDDDHVRRCAGRPKCRALAGVCLRIGGESSSPIAGRGPPFHGVRPMGSEQCALGCVSVRARGVISGVD